MAKHKKTDPGIDVALPIVPMLDMSFQLLFFFIITFNPGKLEGQMSMNLPATGEAKAANQSQVDLTKQSDVEIDQAADYVVSVKAYDSTLTVGIRDSDKVHPVGKLEGLDTMTREDQRVEMNKLLDLLTKMLKERLEEKQKEKATAADNVKIEANSAMKYATLVGVMDACMRAGYKQVGFAPPPDLGQ